MSNEEIIKALELIVEAEGDPCDDYYYPYTSMDAIQELIEQLKISKTK